MKIKNREIYRKALTLAIPMMVQNGITNMVGLVDNVMVGSLGTESITGVAIANQLIFVNNLAIFGGLAGPGIYGAQFYGSGDTKGFRSTFRFKLWIALFCVVLGCLIFSLFGGNLIELYLQGESRTLDAQATLNYGRKYLHIMMLNLFPFAITQVYATSLRETGETVKPMVAGMISVLVDVVLNYILIFGKLGMPRLGVEGAAIATVAARVVECSVVVIWSHIKRNRHRFLQGIYKSLKVPKVLCLTMTKKGLPIFCNEFLWAGGIAVLTQCYSLRGLNVVAGINISNTICNLLNISFISLGSAVGVIVGQYLGASQFDKAKQASKSLMHFTAFVSSLFAIVLIAVAFVFPKFYDTSIQVKNMASWFIVISALFFPVQGYLNAIYFTLRCGGKTFVTFLFDSVFSWVCSVPVALLLCNFTGLPILPIYAMVQALDLIKIAIGYGMIRKGVWIANLVEK